MPNLPQGGKTKYCAQCCKKHCPFDAFSEKMQNRICPFVDAFKSNPGADFILQGIPYNVTISKKLITSVTSN